MDLSVHCGSVWLTIVQSGVPITPTVPSFYLWFYKETFSCQILYKANRKYNCGLVHWTLCTRSCTLEATHTEPLWQPPCTAVQSPHAELIWRRNGISAAGYNGECILFIDTQGFWKLGEIEMQSILAICLLLSNAYTLLTEDGASHVRGFNVFHTSTVKKAFPLFYDTFMAILVHRNKSCV